MSDELTPAPDVDSPELDAAPDTDSQQIDGPKPIVDWQKRATDNQAWATRQAQENAELKERLAAYEAQLSDSPDDEYEDAEYDFADDVARQAAQQAAREVAELKAQLQQQREQADTQAYITSELETLEAEFSDEFSPDESAWLGTYALNHPDPQGNPDVRAAYDQFNRLLEARKSKWVEGKRADRPASGPGAAQVPDLDNEEERVDYIDRLMSGG